MKKNYLRAFFYKDVFNEKKRYEPSIKMISHATWVKGKEKRDKEIKRVKKLWVVETISTSTIVYKQAYLANPFFQFIVQRAKHIFLELHCT